MKTKYADVGKQEKKESKEKLDKIWTFIGGLASLVAIIVFLTGKESIQGLLGRDQKQPMTAPVPSATQKPQYVLQDDFSDPESGWDVSSDGISERYYEDGEYVIHLLSSPPGSATSEFSAIYYDNHNAWSIAELEDLSDAVIEVDARFAGGSTDGAYGVIVYYQGKDSFYFFELTPDGYWDLVHNEQGRYIDMVNFQFAPMIRQQESVNHVRIELSKTVTLYVNDQLISSIDLPYMTGGIGFWATKWRGKEFKAAFDNLTVAPLP